MVYKIIITVSIVIIVLLIGKLSFWQVRDYYYQLKYGVFNVDYELFIKDRALYRASIKQLTPDEVIEKIDSNYFEVPGVMDWLRIPMVYPYTMNFYNDIGLTDNDYIGKGAFLTNAEHIDYSKESSAGLAGEAAYMSDEYGDVLEENIIAFSFNQKYLIGKTSSEGMYDPEGRATISYFIFEFGTNKTQKFISYKALMQEVDRVGYKRHKYPLDYSRESPDIASEKKELRNKLHISEEPELFPFWHLYSRYNSMIIEI